MKTTNKTPLTILHNRFRELEGNIFIDCFSIDDKKISKEIKSVMFNLKEKDQDFINEELLFYNVGTMGVFTNINPLSQPKRIKANVMRIQNIFIDLDYADETHNELLKTFFEKENIQYFYNARSGHGFHFLIPVDLEIDQENKIKGFLTYLHNNVCDKVDIATYTNERLIRVPDSIHNKDEDSKELKTLFVGEPTKEIILENNENVLKLQQEQNKGEKDIAYTNSIKRDDIFFSTILLNNKEWSKYYGYLNKSERRNDVFVKNMGFYLKNSLDDNTLTSAKFFYDGWEPNRFNAMLGWKKKAETDNMNINYLELLSWSKKNKIPEFITLLEQQLKETFLDDYEIYYLEEEKTENNCILYYPLKNYYVQKSIQEVILNIYYDCKEKGIDLTEELKLKVLYDKWEEYNFKKQMTLTQDQIRRILETENRIKMIYNINYKPCEDKFILQEGKKYFNIYNKSKIFDYYKKENNYHFPHIKELLENLTGDIEAYYNYLCKWLAWIIQNPLEKLPTAIILQGQQGSGKGTFKNLILDQIFGSSNVQEINQTHLESQFNEYLLGKQIIVANEVMHNDNRQTLPSVLKNLVTDPEITINRKFKKEIIAKNYTHWIFCTNSENPIKIDKDDRRYSVFFSNKLKGGGKEAADFIQRLRFNLDYELKQFISYLKDLKVEFHEVHEPIMTEAKEKVIEFNKLSTERFIEYLRNFENLSIAFETLTGDFTYVEKEVLGLHYISTEILYLAYITYCKKFGESGIIGKPRFGNFLNSLDLSSEIIYFADTKTSQRVYNIEKIEATILLNNKK